MAGFDGVSRISYILKPQETSKPRSPRVLWITRIFPNRVEPLACPFQRQQLASLSRLCEVEVLAAIPYHPGVSLLGERTRPGRLTAVPDRDEVDGIHVAHPRTPYLPGAGSVLAPVNAPLYLAGLLPHVPPCAAASISCWAATSSPTRARPRCWRGCWASPTR